jgi:hypothetical protein
MLEDYLAEKELRSESKVEIQQSLQLAENPPSFPYDYPE